jgi:hypothetical protein
LLAASWVFILVRTQRSIAFSHEVLRSTSHRPNSIAFVPNRSESSNASRSPHARLRGRTNYRIDYRHIIDWLVRKPGPFASYRYREHLFPTSQFRKVYDLLKDIAPRRCDHRYLEILELAAKEGEARVEDALRLLLQTEMGKQTIVNRESFREFLDRCEQAPDITDVQIADVSLASFDQLFSQPGALQ